MQTPPKLTPYLPAMSEDDEDCYGNVSHLKQSGSLSLSCCSCDALLKGVVSSKP